MARRLHHLLSKAVETNPDQWIHTIGGRRTTHEELWQEAARVAGGMIADGVKPGAQALLLTHNHSDFLAAFWGSLFAGCTPVPLAAPRSFEPSELYRVQKVMQKLEGPTVVDRGVRFPSVPVSDIGEWLEAEPISAPIDSTAPALIQFSSGSTGAPKGALLSHDNVLASVEQMVERLPGRPDDIKLSWMPHYHDMGLVGCHLLPMGVGMAQVRMDALAAVRDPAVWMAAVAQFRGTVLSTTNFALARLTRMLESHNHQLPWDISSIRMIYNGAEPISPDVLRRFCAASGCPESVHFPVYGMSEATVAITQPAEGGIFTRMVEGRELVELGTPLPGMEIRVVSPEGDVLGDGKLGELQFRGPNVCKEYIRDPEATAKAMDGEWMRSGDIVQVVENRLVVTGRAKDIIILNGVNHHAHDLERVAQTIPGVRGGGAVALNDNRNGIEKLVMLVQVAKDFDTAPVLWAVQRAVTGVAGHPPTCYPIPRIPRTTSGKKQRSKLRRQLHAGSLDELVGNTLGIVRAIWESVLGCRIEDADLDTQYRALGGTSIQAMQILVDLEDRLGLLPDHRLLLRGGTIADMARTIEQSPPTDVPVPRRAGAEDIAIVSAACRLPGATTAETFWENIQAGHCFLGQPPSARAYLQPWNAAYIEDVACFDAARWGLEDDDAAAMDPQQRILLDVAADAIARAGGLDTRHVGTFVGAGQMAYSETILAHIDTPLPPGTMAGNLLNMLAARISHHLDLLGPALTVDTACSASLVATHLAIQSLRSGECSAAIVGGVNLNLHRSVFQLFDNAGALSPTGRCVPFAPEADGTLLGEGAVAMVLMPMSTARSQGRPLLGVIRGSAINNDGTSLGVMAPNPAGQEAVIRQAIAQADIDPDTVAFVEAHGTGTRIGDQVERSILRRCYPEDVSVGAVKSRIGHLLGASGIAGLLRLLGELDDRKIGALSSFGFGGTNAHLIVEGRPSDAPLMRPATPVPTRRFWLGAVPQPHRAIPTKPTEPPPEALPDVDGWMHVVAPDPAGGLTWSPCPTGESPLRTGGRYLITGGTGALGASLSLHLAQTRQAELVLVGRSPLEARQQAVLDAVHAAGGTAWYLQADLTRPDEAQSVVHAVKSVDGVFHLAGVVGPQALSVKRDGLVNLDGLTADLWCYFSSISAVLPGLDRGIETYAQANRWLDRRARAQVAEGQRAISIAWGPWAGHGLSASHATDFAARGLTPIQPPQAMQALEWALGSGQPHVVVLKRAPHTATRSNLSDEELADAVRALIADISGHAVGDIHPDATLTELGVDSLEAMDLVKDLEVLIGHSLPTTLLFEHNTLAGILGAIRGGVHRDAPAVAAAGVSSQETAEAGEPILPAQQTFVVQQDFFPDLAGNVLLTCEVSTPSGKPLDPDLLTRAWDAVLERHPALTSVIVKSNDTHLQREGQAHPRVEWRDRLEIEAISNERFDLQNGPLSRCITDGTRIVVNGHHSIVDAWSQKNTLEDLLAAYSALDRGAPLPFSPLRSTWVDAMRTIRSASAGDISWWQKKFQDGVPPLHLPWRRPVDVPSHGGCSSHRRVLDKATTAQIQSLAKEWGVTVPSVVLAAYMHTLWDHSGQPDVTVRVAHGRRELRLPDAARIVGSFADSLPIRTTLDPNSTLQAISRAVHEELAMAQRHADASSMALTSLASHTAAGPVGMSPVGFSFPLLPAPVQIGDLTLSGLHGMAGAGFTRLALIAWMFDDQLHTSWCYARSHLHASDVASLAADFIHHLTAPPVSLHRGLHMRVLARCRMHPERVAVDGVKYGQLDGRSAALAADLAPRNAERIGVLGTPSADAVVCLLGIMRTGAAYVPLDPTWPHARIAQIVAAADLTCVVTTAQHAQHLEGLAVDVVVVDPQATAEQGPEVTGPLAYIMYTSGSTGRPKGVMVRHEAVCTFLSWVHRVFGVTEADRFIQTASLGYGGSIRQIFAPLLVGGTIHPVTKSLARDPDALVAWMAKEGITIWNSVPSMWVHLMDAADRSELAQPFASVRWVLVGGEAVPADMVRRWRSKYGGRLANLYGSTETIVNATCYEVVVDPAFDALYTPIGWSRGGVRTRLIDVRDGVGEIAVGGAIAEGYFDAPDLTEAAFVDHPQWGRMYRTGDLGRHDPDGSLVFLGRRDTQVQVRGNRVELSEIEHTLVNHPIVEHALVVYRDDRLTALVQPRPNQQPTDLRTWVAARLPDYMVPNRIQLVDEIPRNPSGKADRLALERSSQPVHVAAGDMIQMLGRAWMDVLDLSEPPRPQDDFFALGGDSIRALVVLDRIRPHVDATLRPMTLYQFTRLGDLAAAIERLAPREAASTAEQRTEGPYPLSFVQRSFWTTHKRSTGRQPVWCARVALRGPLKLSALHDALDALVQRHSQLRTVFTETRDGPVQQEVPVGPFPLQYDDLTALPESVRQNAIAQRWSEEEHTGFDLAQWPLFRVRACRMDSEHHELILTAHHIVSDAWSFWLMADELCTLHDHGRRARLPVLSVPFRDVVAAQTLIDDPWWRGNLAGIAPLPPADLSERHSETLVLGPREWGSIKAAARHRAVTPYALVLTALARALQSVMSVDDLVIATAVLGRTSAAGDVSGVVGAFARAIPVRIRDTDVAAVADILGESMAHSEASAVSMAAGVPRDALARLARFFLSWLDPSAIGNAPASISVDWRDATFRFAAESTDTELMIGAVADDRLTLHLDGGPLVERLLAPLKDALLNLTRPAAALVVYVPEGHPVPISSATVVETVDAPDGRSEMVLLPLAASHVREGPELDAAVRGALRATQASVIALAGILPAQTGLGTRIVGDEHQRVTTGHTATVIAMVLTCEVVLGVLGRDWSTVHLGVLGHGAIGRAVLAVLRARLGEPASLGIQDPKHPESVADLTGCDLILGATSGGSTLDVASLKPGTVVIDDSFPRAFDDDAALARMKTAGDVLLVGGGMIDVGALSRTSPFPQAGAIRALYPHRWLPGCHAEALLLANHPEMAVTVGVVSPQRALSMLDAVVAMGWQAAPLHLGPWVVPDRLITEFPTPDP